MQFSSQKLLTIIYQQLAINSEIGAQRSVKKTDVHYKEEGYDLEEETEDA